MISNATTPKLYGYSPTMRFSPMLCAVATLGLLTTPLAATVTDEAKSEQATGDERASAKPAKVCKQIKNTGSRTAARKCKTQEQWDAEEAGAANSADYRAGGNN